MKEKYKDHPECKLDDEGVIKQITKYMDEMGDKEITKTKTLNIIPEVSEKLRFTGKYKDKLGISGIDYVNKSGINKEIVRYLKKKKIKLLIPNKKTISKRNIAVQSLEIDDKINKLVNKLKNNKISKDKVNFIVSHGGLLETLYTKLTNKKIKKDSIKNLNLLYISVKNKKFAEVKIFRSPNYKGLLESIKKNKDNNHYLFIRHCPACHNLKFNNQVSKGFNVLKGELTGNKSSGSSSICIDKTPALIRKIKLEPTFKYFKDNNIKYSFNSSIIFRAILTASLLIKKDNQM